MKAFLRKPVCLAAVCLAFTAAPGLAQTSAVATSQADTSPEGGTRKARNVILFLADAGGVPVLSAASLMAYGEPLRLHIQQWPHLGLSETSPVDAFVSDSANGMSAIVTGVKTRNGVISQGPDAVRGETDGQPTKTILEYAEERDLLTGVVTSQSIADATPAAVYAHWNDRADWGDIFPQAFAPRFGNGVDVLFGAGREAVGTQLAARGSSFETLSASHDRPIYARLEDAPDADTRPVVVAEALDVRVATLRALDLLERSPTGYLLVVEWDAHTDDPRAGLQNLADFDRLIAEIQSRVNLNETLLLFTADHSFALQVDGGRRGEPLLEGYDAWNASRDESDIVRLKNVLVHDTHTAEEVPVLAIGPGAEQVRGYFSNTKLFGIIMAAWGWTPNPVHAD